MAIQQFYISWREFVMNRNYRGHPDDFFKISYPAVTYEGKGWSGSGNDTRKISAISYDDTVFSTDDYDGMMAHGSYFDLFELTVNETLNILNDDWYPVTPEDEAEFPDGYFSLDGDGFTIIDNRPVEEDVI